MWKSRQEKQQQQEGDNTRVPLELDKDYILEATIAQQLFFFTPLISLQMNSTVQSP